MYKDIRTVSAYLLAAQTHVMTFAFLVWAPSKFHVRASSVMSVGGEQSERDRNKGVQAARRAWGSLRFENVPRCCSMTALQGWAEKVTQVGA